MHTEQEKTDFSLRLRTALQLAGLASLSNANLANRFNLRHPNQPVSTQAVHYWLVGRSIPTQDKIETLAKWLNTSADWLRYGRVDTGEMRITDEEMLLLKSFRQLSPVKRQALMVLLKQE
ncbi:transcriptional regulator [Neisseria animalis]|uniref:Transcriptional regulator n=1 Tax=Neisseria animalis TaxID=492 RepID=A0A5P3MS22_NEIAN|nr:transcriptional regulator [Neisseria animalis]QEY24393.1 transcriptional regulator [Neisseria animalis]ROW31869.1 transcriptional regulator [Neisseria animalis]VEE06950.1 Uncharacterised protein [Neisseria animalis]